MSVEQSIKFGLALVRNLPLPFSVRLTETDRKSQNLNLDNSKNKIERGRRHITHSMSNMLYRL